MIVVVIIGILAAIAIPKYGQTRQRAYVATMQSDLNRLRSTMELHYQDSGLTYDGAQVETLVVLSPGVVVETEIVGDPSSWSATLGHDAYAGSSCTYDSSAGGMTCVVP
jgi:type II secretory pathway pseudopilin PulG